MRRWLTASALLVFLTVPAWAQDIVGTWYGEGYQTPIGLYLQYLDFFKADGSVHSEFRQFTDCKLTFSSFQDGTWEIKDGKLTIAVYSVDDKPVDPAGHTDVYAIDSITDTEFAYTHLASGDHYDSYRQEDGFKFPPCGPTS